MQIFAQFAERPCGLIQDHNLAIDEAYSLLTSVEASGSDRLRYVAED